MSGAIDEVSRVEVPLGNRTYEILIGRDLIGRTGAEIARRFPGTRVGIVTDAQVGRHHLAALEKSFDAAGVGHVSITVPPGETSKSFERLEAVVAAVLDARLERGDLLVALGGGVVGDLTGFASGVTRRGMRYVQMPTSLLAQVDSSVGGKTGINTRHGKNLVGLFHQPSLVIIDTAALDTLDPRHFRAGYAEVAKYGLIGDPAFFAWLEKHAGAVFAGGPERVAAIAESCRAKAKVVGVDETETGERALLNLGHTFGHALESATGYSDRLVHGEAIAIGMVLAHDFSVRLGLCPEGDADRARRHLAQVGLPTTLGAVPGGLPDAETLVRLIGQDKKVKRGSLTFILTRGIGKAFVANDVPREEVAAFLADKLAK